jgi:hypothetical protein
LFFATAMGGPSLGALFGLEKRLFLVDFDCFLNRGEGLLPGDIGFGGEVIVFGRF